MKTLTLALLMGSPAFAVTVPLYTPGGSPCAGACSLEWAQEHSGVPDGEPAFMTVPGGSYVEWMSYAKDGKPYATRKPAIFADDETGQGYWFQDEDGNARLMFKLDECQNWAVIRPGAPPIRSATPVPVPVPLVPTGGLPGWETPFPPGWGFDPDWCCTTVVDPPPPAPVPVPVPGMLLLSGLGLLALAKSRSTNKEDLTC